MRIQQTVGSEVIHEAGFDDTFYYFGNEGQCSKYYPNRYLSSPISRADASSMTDQARYGITNTDTADQNAVMKAFIATLRPSTITDEIL